MIVNNQLIVFQCFTQVGIQPEIFKYPLIHFWSKNAKLSSSAFLRCVHCCVGVTNNSRAVRTMFGRERNTY
ncbi:Uncharacterised protein [Shigella sonnei]|nr:Uncharacterised protein [Shigella sonnei]